MIGKDRAGEVGMGSGGIPQNAANSLRSSAFSNLRYPGKLEVKPASRVPIALHCPVMENGDAPGRPILPVIKARLLMRFTVSVPLILWFTPIVQPIKPFSACP